MPRYYATTLGDLNDAALIALLGTRCYGNPGLAIGSTTSKVKTANAISYSIGGVLYSKAITDDLFVHTDVTVQAANSTKYYGLFLDASGAATIVQGTSTKLPAYDATTVCMVGYLKIVTTGAVFTPGTTAHTTVTTYVNTAVPPASI